MTDTKMCPLRKQTTIIENTTTETFLPCIRNECEWWIPNIHDKTLETGWCAMNGLSWIGQTA